MLLEEVLSSGSIPQSPVSIKSIERFRHQRKSWILAEERPMPVYKAPIEPVNDVTPWTPPVVAHPEEIVRAANVRLGRKDAAVAEDPHAIDIRAHHPFG